MLTALEEVIVVTPPPEEAEEECDGGRMCAPVLVHYCTAQHISPALWRLHRVHSFNYIFNTIQFCAFIA